MQSTGESKRLSWESLSLLLSLRIWLFLKTKIIRKKNGLFHVQFASFLCWHFYWQILSRSVPALSFRFFFFCTFRGFVRKRKLINMSVISLIRTLIKTLNVRSSAIKHRSEKMVCSQLWKMKTIFNFFRIFLFYISTSLVILQVKSPQAAQKGKKKRSLKIKSWPHWSQNSSWIQPS